MIVRERYMRLIRDFMDKPVIKIITGMRRSGKSALLAVSYTHLCWQSWTASTRWRALTLPRLPWIIQI